MDDLRFLHDSLDYNPNSLPDIFLVEDDQSFGQTVRKFLERKLGFTVHYFNSTMTCLEHLSHQQNSYCLITDISFENGAADGLVLIDLLKERGHNFFSIAMTGFASIETAIAATKKGVFHYLTKPFDLQILVDLVLKGFSECLGVSSELLQAESKLTSSNGSFVFFNKIKIEPPSGDDIFCGMIGRSKKMKEVFERIKKVAATDSTVLVTGPSGTGKELVARAIHTLSKRTSSRLISVNCGAIPRDLLESELFGHVKGAFTGAISNRKGRFELADQGTIFLDEIGDMPLLLQVKILRVLQNKEIEPVGSTATINVDARIITATHRDLEKAVQDGLFREDLFYRLNVIPVKIPALCERREDIPLLISYFLSRFVSADGRNKLEFDDEVLELLLGYDWPGNVRELENLIERLVILKGGGIVKVEDLSAKFFKNRPAQYMSTNLISLPEQGVDLKRILSDIEDSLIEQALERTNGNKNQASKLLQMNRTTLIEKMKKKGSLHL